MRLFKFAIVVLIYFISLTKFIYSQTLEKTLKKLTRDAAIGYVQPIVSGFGANVNSGWMYRSPAAKKFSIDLDIGVVAMGAIFDAESRTFQRAGSFTFDSITANSITSLYTNDQLLRDAINRQLLELSLGVTIEGPTVVGSKNDSVRIKFHGGKIYVPYGGRDTLVDLTPATQLLPVVGLLEDVPLLPFAVPQLSIGTIYGTKVALRYLPALKINPEIGEFSYLGFGIQHNPFMWIPLQEPPLDVSLGIFTQTMKVGDIFKTRATLFGVQASRTLGPKVLNITPYAGLSLESSTINVSYNYEQPNITGQTTLQKVEFDLDGENNIRFTAGASLKLAILRFSADYNIAKYNSVSIGLGLTF